MPVGGPAHPCVYSQHYLDSMWFRKSRMCEVGSEVMVRADVGGIKEEGARGKILSKHKFI